MKLVMPVTLAGRKASEKYQKVTAKAPNRLSFVAKLVAIGPLGVILSIIASSWLLADRADAFLWTWESDAIAFVSMFIAMAPVIVFEWLQDRKLKRIRRTYNQMVESGEIVTVPEWAVELWDQVWEQAGIPADEERADLQFFPEVARKAYLLNERYSSSTSRKNRRYLQRGMRQEFTKIAIEALEPLAIECTTARTLAAPTIAMIRTADRELTEARQLARHIHADQMLKVT